MKNVLITGAAAGIGAAIAEKFAQKQFNLILFDMAEDSLMAFSAKLREQYGIQVIARTVDITCKTAIDQALLFLKQQSIEIDVLINNAGIQHIASITDFSAQAWQQVFAVHVEGSFTLTQACMQQMKKRQALNHILFIGSIHSHIASENKAAYVAAKHAQLGFMRSIAKEGAEFNIAANLVAPGFVRTELLEQQIPLLAKDMGISKEQVVEDVFLSHTIDNQFTTLDEVAEVTYFLGTFNSLALSGQSLLVSHGWCMQ